VPLIDLWINCPDIETADAITDALLTQKLIAAANRYPPIQSAYVWQGEVRRAEEHPLRLKTRADLADAVEAETRRLHPYEVPCILRTDARANADYEAWAQSVTRNDTSR
jgi:periplasmic divalent cation tolerance protein